MVAVAASACGTEAQDRPERHLAAEAAVGSEVEDYLRLLQVAGRVPLHPWSIRGFSLAEVEALAPEGGHPWQDSYRAGREAPGAWIAPLPLDLSARFNIAFPHAPNEGPVWAGRGATFAASAGLAARAGPLSLRIAPQAFWAENREFTLQDHGDTAVAPYAHGLTPHRIDHPQRFGEGPYWRLDAGDSYFRLDVAGAAAGLSTAAQHWGPAMEMPILLGNNAPGFLHGFVGTSRPLDVGVGRVHGRLIGGLLEQTEYSLAAPENARRVMSGLTVVFTPAPIPGLEVGLGRFFHAPRPPGGLTPSVFLKPLEAFVKVRLPDFDEGPDAGEENQLASAFFRWVLPAGGLEVYGEYGREDHSWDALDLLMQPDHFSGFLLGFRKAWIDDDRTAWSVGAEVLDTDPGHVRRVRRQPAFYSHCCMRQGHTHRGQILGAAYGWAGGGSVVAVDRYSHAGRLRAEWLRGRQGSSALYGSGRVPASGETDVIHALSLEGMRLGRRFDVTAGAAAVVNLNRYFEADAFNFNARLGARLVLW
jgi:hypothetical protein